MEILWILSNKEVPQTTLLNTPDTNSASDFLLIWDRAILTYNQRTEGYYLVEGGLGADYPDALFGILNKELTRFKEYRKNGEKVRGAIAPVLNTANLFSETIGEALGMVSANFTQISETTFNSDDIRHSHQRKRYLLPSECR